MSFETNNYFGIGDKELSATIRRKIGILLTNVGSPDEPNYWALRRYLKQFLEDPRVIELNGYLWKPILNLFIIPFRARTSAEKYRSIWKKDGSPLIAISNEQRNKLNAKLQSQIGDQFEIEIGMGYGNPSIDSAIKKLLLKGVDRLLVIPMFPQYAAATTGSTFDGISKTLTKVRAVPELRFITSYYKEPGYISALAESINRHWSKFGKPEKLVFSFHGIPERYSANGDPYQCHCKETAELVAKKMQLSSKDYLVTFQSLFGKEEWLRPYTIEVMEELGKRGVKKLDVICPGFSADCLETIEEIEVENKAVFLQNGGEVFHYIPALNSDDLFIKFFTDFIEQNLSGWLRRDSEAHARKCS